MTWAPSIGQQQPLALRYLFLHNADFEQDSLENLMTFVPQLKMLKLVSMCYHCNSNEGYNGLRLLRHIQSLAMDLDVIYFSKQGQQLSHQIQQQLLKLCPILS